MALETKFHEFVALTASIWCWKVGLGLAVGSGDDFGGGVDTAFADALVTAGNFVRVDRVNGWVVTRLAIGGVGAVGAI